MSNPDKQDGTLEALEQTHKARTPRGRLLQAEQVLTGLEHHGSVRQIKAEITALLDLFPEFKHYPTEPGMELEDSLLYGRLSDVERRAAHWQEFGKWSDRIDRDMARQRGTRAPRFPECDEWMDNQLRRQPDVKAPDLWERAPDWITDRIGFDRFCKRVTAARKRKNAASN